MYLYELNYFRSVDIFNSGTEVKKKELECGDAKEAKHENQHSLKGDVCSFIKFHFDYFYLAGAHLKSTKVLPTRCVREPNVGNHHGNY